VRFPLHNLVNSVRRAFFLAGSGRRWKWWVLIALGVASAVLEAVGAMLMLFLLALLVTPEEVDIPLIEGSSESSGWLAGIVLTFFLIRLAVSIFQVYLQNRVVSHTGVEISSNLLRWYLQMPFVAHVRRNSAELIRNLTESSDLVSRVVILSVIQLTSEALIVLGLSAVLIWTAPLGTLITGALLGGVMFLIGILVQPRLTRLGRDHQHAYKSSLQSLQQSLNNVREIRIFQKQAYFLDHFVSKRARLARVYYIQGTLQSLPRLLIETAFVFFVVAFIIVLGGTPGQFVSRVPVLGLFAYSILRVMPSLNRIMTYLNNLQWGAGAIDDIYRDMHAARESALLTPQESSTVPTLTRFLYLDNVWFRYPGADSFALEEIQLRIEVGESVGVVGETGAGKSTLMDIILGLLEPTRGRLWIDEHELGDNRAGWYAQLGVVPQRIALFDDTLRRNIAFGIDDDEVDLERLKEAISIAQLTEFVSTLRDGINTIVGEDGVRLSGGQRQRVAIARALYRDARLLIFDEGTSALDNLTEAALMDAMGALGRKRTLITVAHRLSTVRRCDRVILLDKGRILDIGSYEALAMRNPKFESMVTTVNRRP
jgi:ATP-binding cassette, subfamily B, bacterial PglK